MRGRKPKPAAIKDLHGNPGKRRRVRGEPKPSAGALRPPVVLIAIAGARRHWDEIVGSAPLVLARCDAAQLASLCIALATRDKAVRMLRGRGKNRGHVIETAGGTLIQSPWVGILNRSIELALRIASALCLPPAERARLGALSGDPPLPDPGDEDGAAARGAQAGDDLDTFLALHPDRVLN